jgi:hypothetical protein
MMLKAIAILLACAAWASAEVRVVCPSDATPRERLAAAELRRYVFLRTGTTPALGSSPTGRDAVIELARDPAKLRPEQYELKTIGKRTTITGGDDRGVLYGAYRYVELLGVRFYLHGDVIPDERLQALPAPNETGKPLFDTRGIQPFHDFPEGPDWWNQDDYLAYLSQLAKLRMNFLGLHCYPEGGVGPEPLVWIGVTNDLAPGGSVKFSYPSFWANTSKGMWGYAPMKTSEFAGGAAQLFPADDYGPEVAAGLTPRPVTPEQCNEMFDRVGRQMKTVFACARELGIKTCIGTETPLTMPKAVRAHLQQLGLDPADTNTIRALYTGMFKRIAEACPVDYYWLWTPEGWTWGANKPQQFEATRRDIQTALAALDALGKPFTLATSGWVLGPAHDRAALDEFLPKSSPMSCINRAVGHDGVEPAFANITGRPKWAIPWMENDPDLVGPQPWAARMRYDAVDARRFGCTGLLGIHWRTKALAPNIAALAAATWDQSWVPAGFDTQPVKPSRGGEGALGGSVAHFTAPVADAAVPAVYQNVRYNLDGYSLTIPDGTYTITLQFNEPAYAAAGKRVFGAAIQGRQVITNLDIFARVGQNKALDLSFPNVAVTNGTLRIAFTREVEFPCIAGIVVDGKTKANNQLPSEPFARKINCGGEKAADYEADRVSGGAPPPAPRDRAMPIEDFYVDFARANFGDSVAEPAGKLMAKMDGVHMPQASDWKNGPGNLVANPEPWSEVKPSYAFVDELAALRPQVKGPGNHARFDYWLNTWRGMAAMAEVCCVRGQLDKAMAAKNYSQALANRIELARGWGRLLALQTAVVSTPGELGTIANLELHTRRESHFLDAHDAALSQALGTPLPAEAVPPQLYTGTARLIVPTVRTVVGPGEALSLKIIALDSQPVKSVTVKFRPLGKSEWQTAEATHQARAVWQAKLPPATDDFEYYLEAKTAREETLRWPVTAPGMNQTVVAI